MEGGRSPLCTGGSIEAEESSSEENKERKLFLGVDRDLVKNRKQFSVSSTLTPAVVLVVQQALLQVVGKQPEGVPLPKVQ